MEERTVQQMKSGSPSRGGFCRAAAVIPVSVMSIAMLGGGAYAASPIIHSSSSQKLVLTMWGSSIDQNTFQERANSCTKSMPGVSVAVKNIPTNQYGQEVETMIAGGTSPDIIEVGQGQYTGEQYLVDGALLNLNKYISASKWDLTKQFSPSEVSGYNYHGIQFAI